MKVIAVSRKPCSEGSTTANVAQYSCGALNIDACRVRSGAPPKPTTAPGWDSVNAKNAEAGYRPDAYRQGGATYVPRSEGRWPANLVLWHLSGCVRTGTATAPGYTINRWRDGAKPFGGGAGHEYESEQLPEETVDVWECEDGCAVGELGAQSGDRVSTWTKSHQHNKSDAQPLSKFRPHQGHAMPQGPLYADAGTAARFFKQTQEQEMSQIPDELWDYLTTMISPPADCDPVLIVCENLEEVDWGTYDDASVHGMVMVGNPASYMEEIDRVLKPGAHMLVIAPDDEPTGHTGACAVEEYGFEIRDAIALLDRPDDFHYVAKASSSERNAGLPDFEQKVEVDRAFPREGADLEDLYEQISEMVDERWLENWEEEGVPPNELSAVVMEGFEIRKVEDTKTHRNNHPTVKSVGVMERLLRDVPKDQGPVIDPFMGSGTTGVACLRTGHDFVGIEQDPDYIKIADHRVRHWDRAIAAWNGAEIASEAVIEDDDEPVSLGDFFGG